MFFLHHNHLRIKLAQKSHYIVLSNTDWIILATFLINVAKISSPYCEYNIVI